MRPKKLTKITIKQLESGKKSLIFVVRIDVKKSNEKEKIRWHKLDNKKKWWAEGQAVDDWQIEYRESSRGKGYVLTQICTGDDPIYFVARTLSTAKFVAAWHEYVLFA